ncbi:MAG: hypothetical protein II625_07445 [Bacilli bacterium]|nr:hypothetical protein [Bacilli bacterium]
MKKVLTFILCFLFIGIVKAESCIVVSGTGTNYGDEVQCGSEHFYVLDYTKNKTKLMAKYNLMVGDKISFIEATEDAPLTRDYNNFETFKAAVDEYCDDIAEEQGYDAYYTYAMPNTSTGELKGCRVYENIEYEHALQDSKAEGTILVNGKSKLPLYGITYMVPEWGYDAMEKGIIKENEYDRNGDLIIDGSSYEEYLNDYKEELERQGIKVEKVAFPTLDGILDFLEDVSGETIDIELLYPEHSDPEDPSIYYIGKMDVRDYIEDKYSWLIDRTYWLGSGFEYNNQPNSNYGSGSEYNDYYLSNEGFLCALGRGECGYFEYPIGNGLRPVITVSSEDIGYKIETKTDGNGEIKSEKIEAKSGEVIIFTVTPDEGYVIGVIKVTDANGNVITFTKDELKGNTFTMPSANVLIEATFVVANAKTATFISVTIILIEVIAFSVIFIMNKKLKKEQ